METPQIVGADKIVAWWGEWITFHDFQLLKLPATGSPNGEIRIHGWITDWNTTDAQGYVKTSNDCIVTIELRRIRSMKLSSEEIPAIIFELTISPAGSGWAVTWDSSYGAEGTIEAEEVRLDLEPGLPETGGRS